MPVWEVTATYNKNHIHLNVEYLHMRRADLKLKWHIHRSVGPWGTALLRQDPQTLSGAQSTVVASHELWAHLTECHSLLPARRGAFTLMTVGVNDLLDKPMITKEMGL